MAMHSSVSEYRPDVEVWSMYAERLELALFCSQRSGGQKYKESNSS